MIKGIVPALTALLLILLAGQELSASEYGSAARVNGVDISLFRLERHFEDYLREQNRNVAQIRNPSVFKRLKHEALEQLIDKELLRQEAGRLAIEVSDAEVARVREQVAGNFSNPEAFARRLQQAGFDEVGYADYLRHEIAAERALNRLLPTVTVSDEEVRGMYQTLRGHLQEAGVADGDEAGQMALLRRVMLERRSVEARSAVLQRLRAEAQIERLLPL